jgi:hypothetical protein
MGCMRVMSVQFYIVLFGGLYSTGYSISGFADTPVFTTNLNYWN